MLKRKRLTLTAPAALLAFMSVCQPAVGGTASGRVNAINVNPTWDGFMVQLDNSTSFTFDATCPLGNWAYMRRTNAFYASTLAALLSAKATGDQVTIVTTGCIETALPTILAPGITSIDVGQRNGS